MVAFGGKRERLAVGSDLRRCDLAAHHYPATFCLIPNKPLNGKFVEDAPVAEADLVNEDAHPAAQYGKGTPSYATLNNSVASKAELELGSSMIFNQRSGSNILSGSRAM